MKVVALGTTLAPGRVALATSAPTLSWRVEGGDQVAYEIEQLGAGRVVVELGARLDVAWPFAPLRSRERSRVRVRVRSDEAWSSWSAPLVLEAGLLDDTDWVARPVHAVDDPGRDVPGPAVRFGAEFTVGDVGRDVRLYVTALGTYTAWLNGHRVGDRLLAPGWVDYRTRMPYDTVDAAALLRPGRNVLVIEVADGWYRGDLGFVRRRNWYGDRVAALAQLEVDGRVVVASDRSWRASADGAVRSAGLYDGTDLDLANGGSDPVGAWGPVDVGSLPVGLYADASPPVRVTDRLVPVSTEVAGDVVRLDFGQNIAGHVALDVRGPAGATLQVRHAEVCAPDGSLHTAALRTARATDTYRLGAAPGVQQLTPPHTYHGFRYAEVERDARIEIVEACAEVVGSDLVATGEFASSDESVSALHRNVRWSLRGNFLSIPTDCPQRDERLGWTGDISVFAPAACHNYDVRGFLDSWLRDVSACQRADGAVGSIVPDVDSTWPRAYGAAGWGDAAVTVPWALWEAYGDVGVLERQYASMRRWVDYCAGRTDPDGAWSADDQFGDWLDPGAPAGRPDLARTDAGFVATACLARSARLLAAVAEILADDADAERFATLAALTADVAWRRWSDHAVTTQTGCALALRYGIAAAADRDEVADRLAGLVRDAHWRIGTGFLGTPELLPALSESGHTAEAYRVLLNRQPPSWLAQVARGATTIWERWDALDEDGSVADAPLAGVEGVAEMLSFNHYAYGAVDAWLHRVVAGLAPAGPGYRTIRFAPEPGGGITGARSSLRTRYGDAAIDWSTLTGRLVVDLTVPWGTSAVFRPPIGCDDTADVALGPGRHRVERGIRAQNV